MAAERSSGALLVGGLVATLAVFAADRMSPFGAWLAGAGVLAATVGALDLAGAFAPEEGDDARAIPARELSRPLLVLAAALLALVFALRAATAGVLGVGGAALLVPAAFLGALLAVRSLATKLGAKPLDGRSPTLWIGVGVVLLYLPLLGAFGLVDPWESHYAEVAREMIARDDALSSWWAQDKWFWTKPVLDLWLEAISMRALGVSAASDTVLAAVHGFTPRPEWALRLPSFLFSLVGLYLFARGAALRFGGRAAAIATIALATMPQFFIMARQATTDMPLVGALMGAFGLLLVASSVDDSERAASCAIRTTSRVIHLSLAQIPLLAVSAILLPQVLYLVTRNVTLHAGTSPSLDLHADLFRSGSPGNCDLPANAPCAIEHPQWTSFTPALQAAVWFLALVVVLALNVRERRLARVAYFGAFVFGALATMAKGPLGVVLPGCAYLAAIALTGEWRRLRAAPILSGTLFVIAATAPWYVALLSRHGKAFTDELVFKHMIGRATSHLHDTNQGDDVSFRYYLWQGGFALFGWLGFAPLGFARWAHGAEGQGKEQAKGKDLAQIFTLAWAAFAFALFTVMPTKFHHYIFPALPAVALLLGLGIDGLFRAKPGEREVPTRLALVAGALATGLVTRDLAVHGLSGEGRLLNLVTYNYQRLWPEMVDLHRSIGVAGASFTLLLLAACAPRARRYAIAAFLGASALFTAWGVDGYMMEVAPHWSQRQLIERYMATRSSDKDPLGAFNMNWKGENFYTGNHVAVFPAGGKIRPWMEARRAAGAEAFFFLIEHFRQRALESEMGAGVTTELLTAPNDNNKFVLVRARFAAPPAAVP